MRDARVEKAEQDAFFAERAERKGDFASARRLYLDAASAFAVVALGVPADHPNTRSDLATAAVASYARANEYNRAVEFARRMLAEPDALTEHGRGELSRLALAYGALAPAPAVTQTSRSAAVRDEVRNRFRKAAA